MLTIRTAARAIIQQDDKLLVIRYCDEQGEFYALPGGSQRHGESLTEAVVREVAEETGTVIRAGALRFVRECRGSPQSRSLPPEFHALELFFECELVSEGGMATDLDPGQADALWLSIANLRSRCFFPPALLDALEQGVAFGYLGVV